MLGLTPARLKQATCKHTSRVLESLMPYASQMRRRTTCTRGWAAEFPRDANSPHSGGGLHRSRACGGVPDDSEECYCTHDDSEIADSGYRKYSPNSQSHASSVGAGGIRATF